MGMYCNVFAASSREVEALLLDPDSIDALHFRLSEEVNLEKAWHGLHYLLTGHVWGTKEPLGFLVTGGRPIGEATYGFLPTRLFSPDSVKALAQALSAVSDEELWSRFDAKLMIELAVYPMIWDEAEDDFRGDYDLREEYFGYFHDLKAFICKAASDGSALLVQTPKLRGIDDAP